MLELEKQVDSEFSMSKFITDYMGTKKELATAVHTVKEPAVKFSKVLYTSFEGDNVEGFI